MEPQRETFPGDDKLIEAIKSCDSLGALMSSPGGTELVELIYDSLDELFFALMDVKDEMTAARIRGQMFYASRLLTAIQGRLNHGKHLRQRREQLARHFEDRKKQMEFREERRQRVTQYTRDGV